MHFIYIFLILSLSSCITMEHNTGNTGIVNPNKLNFDTGNTTKEDIILILGSPTITENVHNIEKWIYIYDRNEKVAFMNPQLADQLIYKFYFNQDNVLTRIDRIDMANRKKIGFSTAQTPEFGNDNSLLKEIFANLGRFNKRSNRK